MYLRECLIENVGPIDKLDVSLSLDSEGNPKPLILVGKNGTGKTIFLAYILDALAELAKKKFRDVVAAQESGYSQFFKTTSGGDIRSLSGSSLCLLEFSDADSKFCYVERVGTIDSQSYVTKLRDRFEPVQVWGDDEVFHKRVTGAEKQIESFFQNKSICFFPSSRHERPHWLNLNSVEDQPLFGNNQRLSGLLGKPLIVERAAEDNRQWLMEVLLDSLVDGDFIAGIPTVEGSPNFIWQPSSNLQDKLWLKAGRQNIELLLRLVIEDKDARLILNYRNEIHGRVAIRLGNGVIVPSLIHLSAGQALLFNLFATIVRYADRTDLQKSINLHEVEGIILVDEIDAHLHTDLQYEVLPKLVKLFPKVQFIITSHAPLFLLGMEREFGSDGIQILEMPTARKITTERFDEFLKSFEFYRQTQIFENAVEEQVRETSKPLVLTEGKTDVTYIKTALELLGYAKLLEQLEIDEVGKTCKEGAKGGGHTNLDTARKFLENNQDRFPRRVLFLYDCDTRKDDEGGSALLSRCIPPNNQNTKVSKGIENLLPSLLFEEKFYSKQSKEGGDGGETTTRKLKKQEFCEWICDTRRERDDFLQFDELLVPILQEFISMEKLD